MTGHRGLAVLWSVVGAVPAVVVAAVGIAAAVVATAVVASVVDVRVVVRAVVGATSTVPAVVVVRVVGVLRSRLRRGRCGGRLGDGVCGLRESSSGQGRDGRDGSDGDAGGVELDVLHGSPPGWTMTVVGHAATVAANRFSAPWGVGCSTGGRRPHRSAESLTGATPSSRIEHMFDSAQALVSLATLDGSGLDEAAMVDQLAALEQLKAGTGAAQVRVTDSLVQARTRREAASGIPASKRCQGLAGEIALARRTSPHRASRDMAVARALVHDLPRTLASLTRGDISEWRATLVARETDVLTPSHRAQVDAELGSRLRELGDRATAAEARKIGYRLDPQSAVRRTRGAQADRYVSVRPAPDTMTYLTGFLPVPQGVACFAALRQHADSLRARGDERSRGQIMADTLVERVTGQTHARAVDVEVGLVMTDRSLLAGDDSPAHLDGYGPVPAEIARQITRDADRAWIRRLYTRPDDGSLVAMDSHRRGFDGERRHFLVLRDQFCRTPWCDAPVRHTDHLVRVADGGETSIDNGQGLCEACNYAKEAAGWRSRRIDTRRHLVEITTPTGHSYTSRAPDPPRSAVERGSPLEKRLREILAA